MLTGSESGQLNTGGGRSKNPLSEYDHTEGMLFCMRIQCSPARIRNGIQACSSMHPE